MHDALARMLAKYKTGRLEDAMRALREIMQEIALLGLWRSKFFESAAFYGGTATGSKRIYPGYFSLE